MYYRVWVASPRFHGTESLTYNSPDKLNRGQVVSVPLQRQTVLGIVEAKVSLPGFKTKPILSSWPFFIPKQQILLLQWLQQYYPSPLGSLVELITPPSLIKKLVEIKHPVVAINTKTLPPLTKEQSIVYEQISYKNNRSFLIHGDTGTGKTRIYLELAIRTVKSGQSCLILTPEIGLTEQLQKTFKEVFGSLVLVTHSDMSPVKRRNIWQQIASSTTPLVVIGPRSAIFSPLANLGLIVMDEAHDSAYKQEQAPYYQASRVAAKLAQFHKSIFVMGSATPLIVDYYAFGQKNLPILRMTQQALEVKVKTIHKTIDHRDKTLFDRSPWVSSPLLKAIDRALGSNEQSLLFLNRRGSARLVLCSECGWQAMCPHCDVALTYHQDHHSMRCHSCNFAGPTPTNCPVCKATALLFQSIGTKALESEMRRLYPNANIARFDRDTPLKSSISNQYSKLFDGTIDILIGTQAVAKGFDLPKLSVAGIIQADSGLQIPDYTSSERTFQLISQVSGRIGRGHLPGKLFIQSFQPENPLITQALSRDYETYYSQELAERKLFRFPPYYFLLKVSCVRATSTSAQKACEQIANLILQKYTNLIVEGPTPRFIEKISGRYGWHLVVKAAQRTSLLEVIKLLPSNCTYDIDPSDLL